MFSGITKGLFQVVSINKRPGLMDYTVSLSPELVDNLQIGASIAIDGVCQSLVKLDGLNVSFQAIQETLDKTTLNELELDSYVSVERSLRYGDEIGGHEVSGHIHGTAVIHQKIMQLDQLTLLIRCDPIWMKYIVSKGFIAVDGSSLTVGETLPQQGLFYLHLIPETLRLTRFAHKQVGARVNIEFDQKTKLIVETVERLLSHNAEA